MLMERARIRESIEILAYCLMPNHVHLVCVPPSVIGLSRFMQWLSAQFAKYSNSRNGNTGHVWEQRFYSVPMDLRHAVAAGPYVLLNPVKAGLTASAVDWPYTSVHELLGESPAAQISEQFPELMAEWRRQLLEGRYPDATLVESIRRPRNESTPRLQVSDTVIER